MDPNLQSLRNQRFHLNRKNTAPLSIIPPHHPEDAKFTIFFKAYFSIYLFTHCGCMQNNKFGFILKALIHRKSSELRTITFSPMTFHSGNHIKSGN